MTSPRHGLRDKMILQTILHCTPENGALSNLPGTITRSQTETFSNEGATVTSTNTTPSEGVNVTPNEGVVLVEVTVAPSLEKVSA